MKQGGLVTLKTAQYQCCPLMGFGTYYVITMEKTQISVNMYTEMLQCLNACMVKTHYLYSTSDWSKHD